MRYILAMLLILSSAVDCAAVLLDDELAYRVRFSQARDVALLIKKGANPDLLNDSGLPMVSVAALRKDGDALSILEALVAGGADINQGGYQHQYPMIIAARENNVEMMRFLIKQTSADYSVTDHSGMTPLDIANYYGNEEIVALILEMERKQLLVEQEKHSPARRDALIRTLAHHYCEHQYMHYYFRSGQGKHTKQEAERILQPYREKSETILITLYNDFNVDYGIADQLNKDVALVITKELDAMVSNRERRRRGVGSEQDMQHRCNLIVEPWFTRYSNNNLQ